MNFIELTGLTECPYGPSIEYEDRNPVTGKFYKTHGPRQNYARAQEICESEGAHLLMIKTDEDAQFIQNYYGNGKNYLAHFLVAFTLDSSS